MGNDSDGGSTRMSVQWLEQPTDPTISLASNGVYDGTPAWPESSLFGTVSNGDTVSRFTQPQTQSDPYDGASSWSGGMYSIISQLMSVIGQLLGQMSGGSWGSGSGEQYFSSASGGSNGDPHLSFNGNTWNDMSSQPNLLNSDSIPGGYRLSTQATTPNSNGVTYNQQATVTTHNGNTQVSLDKNGNATLTRGGMTTSISPGQTIDLRNETIARNQDGSLQIVSTNPSGGQIVTTMSQTANGNGVNVNTTATDVDLGGALKSANNHPPQTTS
jgi:hypothetical protein